MVMTIIEVAILLSFFFSFSNCFQSLTAAVATSASCCCCTFAMLFGAASAAEATKNCKVHKMLLPQHKGIYTCALPVHLCVCVEYFTFLKI